MVPSMRVGNKNKQEKKSRKIREENRRVPRIEMVEEKNRLLVEANMFKGPK